MRLVLFGAAYSCLYPLTKLIPYRLDPNPAPLEARIRNADEPDRLVASGHVRNIKP